MHVAGTLVLFMVLSVCTWCYGAVEAEKDSAAKEEKPAIELGGYVTVACASDMSDFNNPFKPGKDGIFCALTIHLPGFQRNTLTRE